MADTSNSVLFDAPGPKGRRTIRIVNWIAGILFAVVLVLILMRLHNPPDGENQLSWELWKPAIEREAWTDFYLPGLWMTIKATVVAVVGAVVRLGPWCWPWCCTTVRWSPNWCAPASAICRAASVRPRSLWA